MPESCTFHTSFGATAAMAAAGAAMTVANVVAADDTNGAMGTTAGGGTAAAGTANATAVGTAGRTGYLKMKAPRGVPPLASLASHSTLSPYSIR